MACGGVAFCLAYTLVFVPESLSRPAQLLVSPPAIFHSWRCLHNDSIAPNHRYYATVTELMGRAHVQQPGVGAWTLVLCHLDQKLTSTGRHWGIQASANPLYSANPAGAAAAGGGSACGQAQQPGLRAAHAGPQPPVHQAHCLRHDLGCAHTRCCPPLQFLACSLMSIAASAWLGCWCANEHIPTVPETAMRASQLLCQHAMPAHAVDYAHWYCY